MSESEAAYERAVRLGRLIPKVVVRYIEQPTIKSMENKATKTKDLVVKPYEFYRTHPTPQDILTIVSNFYGVTVDEIKSARRSATFVYARQVACYLAKNLTLLSYPQIGNAIGYRDHTTIIHACRKIEALAETNERLQDEIALLKMKIVDYMEIRNRLTCEAKD